MENTKGKRAVFLDRDGTIIVEKNFIGNPDDVELIDGSAQAIKLLSDEGFAVVCISNQSGVARGFFDESAVSAVNKRMLELLDKNGAYLDAIYYCPHFSQNGEQHINEYLIDCDCRKPKTGMVEKAIEELGIIPAYVIGDRETDIELARKINVPAILVLTGYGTQQPKDVLDFVDFIAQNLLDAANWILQKERCRINLKQ